MIHTKKLTGNCKVKINIALCFSYILLLSFRQVFILDDSGHSSFCHVGW